MSFTDKLGKLSQKIRRYATGREFEEEGYLVKWDGPDGNDPYDTKFAHAREVNLDRYKHGPIYNEGYDNGGDNSDNFNYFVRPGSEVWEYKFQTFDWINDAIMKYGKSYPRAMRRLIESLKKMPDRLCAKSEWHEWQGKKPEENPLNRDYNRKNAGGAILLLENGIGELNNWSGETAGAYVTTFGHNGENWTEIVQGNYYLAELLVASAEAQLGVFVTARESVMNIAEDTSDALWNLNDSGSSDLQSLLTILGAIICAPIPGMAGDLVGAGFELTEALVDQAENGGNIVTGAKSSDELEINGDTVNAVLQSMTGAFESLDKLMIEKEYEIHNALRGAYNGVLDSRRTYEIKFDKGTASLSPDNLGTRSLSAPMTDLKAAAEVAFPGAAKPMLEAHATLAESGGDYGEFTSEAFDNVTSVHSAWIDLRDLLQDITGANGQKMKRAGEVLLDYAVAVGEVDESSANNVEKIYKELHVEYSGTNHEDYVHVPAKPNTGR